MTGRMSRRGGAMQGANLETRRPSGQPTVGIVGHVDNLGPIPQVRVHTPECPFSHAWWVTEPDYVRPRRRSPEGHPDRGGLVWGRIVKLEIDAWRAAYTVGAMVDLLG